MKAKELFKKFDDLKNPEKIDKKFLESFWAIEKDIHYDLSNDAYKLAKYRNAKIDLAFSNIVKELNNKKDAINRLVAQKYPEYMIDPDSFFKYFCSKNPDFAIKAVHHGVISAELFQKFEKKTITGKKKSEPKTDMSDGGKVSRKFMEENE